ncbi:TatD family deoxyribonuclease [Deltaproteobacteria bacterium PRO3]|nr:TatD family deoxyribonuclease [Deltaproteobacteria bacterium PRO3]
MYIDTHAHIDFSTYSPEEIEPMMRRAREAGVDRIVHIASGEGTASMEGALKVVERFPEVVAAIGVHPHDAKLVDDVVLARARELAAHPKVAAIGEVGLDFHYNHSTREEQFSALRRFVALAREVKKPLVIHDRDSHDELLQVLKEEGAREVGGVFHCFSGDYEFGKRVLDENFLVSFTGIVTFKKAEVTQDAARRLPLDRMLIETDSPYLAPVPYRGKTNNPSYVVHVAQQIAELRGCAPEDIALTTSRNFERLFKRCLSTA